LFLESVVSKASKMPQSAFKKQKRHSTQIINSTMGSNFEMIKNFKTSTAYEYVEDWYVEIESPMNMFPDMYLLGSMDGNDIQRLGIIVSCYALNHSQIDFQMEVTEENEVKLFSCQVEYTKFRPDLIDTNKELLESIKKVTV
jgi:hypothetical protein